MKTLSTLTICLGLLCAVPPAYAQREATTSVHVAAGDLEHAVESLGKQTGTNVLYPGDLLRGRTTAGVEGRLTPREAFARLLQGSSLTVVEEQGALRIAQAAASPVRSAAPPGVAAPSAQWTQQEIEISCDDCDWRVAMTTILERLGAVDVSVSARKARFVALAPAEKGDDEIASQLGSATRWQRVSLDLASLTPKRMSSAGRAAWADTVRNRLLPLFTTRDVRRSAGMVSAEVLVAEPASALSECHRVAQQGRVQRYCGRPDQWEDLRARVGFSCRDDSVGATGSRIIRPLERRELCASEQEWKRVAQARARQGFLTSPFTTNEATQSSAQLHGAPSIGPTIGAPVTPPAAPAPTPAPAR